MQSRHDRILGRIFAALDQRAFRVDDITHLPAAVRHGIDRIAASLGDDTPSSVLHAAVRDLGDRGVFSRARAHSVHAMIDLHPTRSDHDAAGRALDAMQAALLDEADPIERARGADALDRLRGARDFLERDFEGARAHYTAAFERRPSATNMANVLAVLIQLGDTAQAEARLEDYFHVCPADVAQRLEARIYADPDLAPLILALPGQKAVA